MPRGGKREGAGRPEAADKLITKTYRLLQSDIDILEKLAGNQGITASEVMRNLIRREGN